MSARHGGWRVARNEKQIIAENSKPKLNPRTNAYIYNAEIKVDPKRVGNLADEYNVPEVVVVDEEVKVDPKHVGKLKTDPKKL